MEDKPQQQDRKPVRIWIDMCADMFHWGHANALRQAREMGDILVVGIHPDEEIRKNKGPPVMNQEERLAVIGACKWVDEVTLDAPYTTSLATLEKFNIDFAVHGEDITTNADGTDSYEEVKKAGKFKLIKRSAGVSTTDLVGRMLLLTKSHFDPSADVAAKEVEPSLPSSSRPVPVNLVSSRTLYQFSNGRVPKEGDRVCYIDGSFDLFHAGHVNALRQARELGDFLIVGVHSDQDVNFSRGTNYPIMNLHERVLCVLSCKWADEVLIGAPVELTDEFLTSMRITYVIHGDDKDVYHPSVPDPYRFAKSRGIYREIKCTPGLSTHTIVERILENRLLFIKRNQDREKKDALVSQQLAEKEKKTQSS